MLLPTAWLLWGMCVVFNFIHLCTCEYVFKLSNVLNLHCEYVIFLETHNYHPWHTTSLEISRYPHLHRSNSPVPCNNLGLIAFTCWSRSHLGNSIHCYGLVQGGPKCRQHGGRVDADMVFIWENRLTGRNRQAELAGSGTHGQHAGTESKRTTRTKHRRQRAKGRGLIYIVSGWWVVETGEGTNKGQVKLIGAEQVIEQAGNTQGQKVKCLKWEER